MCIWSDSILYKHFVRQKQYIAVEILEVNGILSGVLNITLFEISYQEFWASLKLLLSYENSSFNKHSKIIKGFDNIPTEKLFTMNRIKIYKEHCSKNKKNKTFSQSGKQLKQTNGG